jgi:hypothetical protein
VLWTRDRLLTFFQTSCQLQITIKEPKSCNSPIPPTEPAKMSAQQGPNSGGDLFDMAKDGTTVPEDAAKQRTIPSKPRPDQIASDSDPNQIGGTTLAEAADNAGDIPRVCICVPTY